MVFNGISGIPMDFSWILEHFSGFEQESCGFNGILLQDFSGFSRVLVGSAGY